MFVTLSLLPAQRRKRRASPAVTVRQVRLPGAVSFYRMTAQTVGEKVPWDAISAAAGALRGSFLLPAGLALPGDSGIRVFAPQELPALLLFNKGLSVLRAQKLSAREITVLDEAAVLADVIDRLAPFARSLRVLTAKPARFAPAQRRLLTRWGLSLCVSGPASPLPAQGVLFACSAGRAPRFFEGLVFTCERRLFIRAQTVVGEHVTLPPAFEALRPPEIDRTQFAAALFERCGVKELGEMEFD